MTFKLKSGNTSSFKMMGASPAKNMKTGSYKHPFEASPAKHGGHGKMKNETDHEKYHNVNPTKDLNKAEMAAADKPRAKAPKRGPRVSAHGQGNDAKREAMEDARGVGKGGGRKVMKDGPKKNAVMNGKVIKGGFEPHQFRKKVDPDAPGTPGKPGYEPPVKRSDLDDKGKKLYDSKRKAKPSPAKNFLEKIDKISDKTKAHELAIQNSPAKAACAPGGKSNEGGKCGNFKVNKKGTVVSRLANKVGKKVKNTTKKITKGVTNKVKKIKKNRRLNKDSSGSHKTVRYL